VSLTFTDVFCGAGGSSIGLAAAGFELRLAANHWDRAIETHAANFPDADHLCADVSNYDMRRLPRTDVGWFSPECTWNSPAGGRPRRRKQLDLFDDYVPSDAEVRSRATMVDVIRATEARRYAAVVVENVVEIAEWELFDWWLAGMDKLGYRHQIVCVSSAHVGGPGNSPAPQWRDRLYVCFVRDGVRQPDLDPRPPAWCPTCDELVEARQVWKRPDRPRIGKYGQQYLYRCPHIRCHHTVVEPYVLPAAAAIDWSDVGQRIGDRRRPLAAATMRRIRAGLAMFAQPVTVAAGGGTFERDGSGYVRAWPALDAPLRTRTGTAGDGIATPPLVVNTNHDDARAYPAERAPLTARTTRIGDGLVTTPAFYLKNYGAITEAHYRAWPVDNPLGAITTHDYHSLVSLPFLTVLRRHSRPQAADDTPPATVTAEGNHHAVVTPPGAFLTKHHGGLDYGPIDHMNKPVTDPLPTVVGRPNVSLVVPYRRARVATTAEPLHTLATHDSAALCSVEVEPEDCHFRMLGPREHLAGQRFPATYIVHGNKGEQTMQAGNAVSANVAQWIGHALADVLGGGS
jgi:DNA (cytosine-5)-methyltransferase 1